MIHYESHETLSHALTPEGVQISQQGSHEARVWAALPAKGAGSPVPPAELKKIIGDEAAKVGQGRAFKNGWIAKDGGGLVKAVRQRHPAGPAACLTYASRVYQGVIDRGHDPKRTP
jgi:phenylalanyl-tRNA synthetase alpha chain